MTNILNSLRGQDRIKYSDLFFVPLPFGSGNDQARVFNWGAMGDDKHLFYLR